MRDIGKNIKSLREDKKLSQEQLAEMLFVTRQTVSNYETGRSRPDVEMLTRIAEVLDVDANTIIYGVAPSHRQRSERKALIIAFVITLILGITWFALEPLAQDYQKNSFDVFPQILMQIIILPIWLITLGWTFMQASSVFLSVKHLKWKRMNLIKHIIFTTLMLWVICVLPPLIDILRLSLIRWQWLQSHSSFSSADFALSHVLESLVWNPLSSILVLSISNYCGVFPVFGIALWLAGFPKREHPALDNL